MPIWVKIIVFAALLGALIWAVTQWQAARHDARALQSYPALGEFIEVDGHRLHYVTKGQGPDLVLIHGSSGNLRDFTFQLVDMLAPNFRVIAFDRPGLGHTPRINDTGATIRQQAALMQKAATQLGANQPIVLGQSYGGAVALAWGVDRPQDTAALVLVSAPTYPWTSALSTYYKITSHPWIGPLAIPFITAWVPESVVQDAVAEVFLPQDEPAGYAEHFGVALTLRTESLRANALQRRNLLAEVKELAPLYDRLTMPMELVHGDADTTVGIMIHSEPFAQAHPNAHLTPLPGVGHMPHHTNPADIVAAIDRVATRAGLR